MKIGIPRCLFYYYHYPQWKTFFASLGHEVVVSRKTDKGIANQGISSALTEACYPIKVAYGHVMELGRQPLDYVFVPRLMSVESQYYICPKFMGLPDMIRAQMQGCPAIIDLCVDYCRDKRRFNQEFNNWTRALGAGKKQLAAAWQDSDHALRELADICQEGYTLDEGIRIWEGENIVRSAPGDLTIGLLGHCYTLNDELVSLGIIKRLREMEANVVMAEMRNQKTIEAFAEKLPKRMFWTVGRKLVGAALDMDADPAVDGLIYLSCFGCGPDSIVSEVIQHRLVKKPIMILTVDEHSGEAGAVTRLEAFCDMLRRNNRIEGNLSSYGQYTYSN